MFTIYYRQHCDQCDSETGGASGGLVGGVVTSSERGCNKINGYYFSYLDSTDSLVPLPQAGRNSVSTWLSAAIQGRLFQVTKMCCKDCGTINHSPRLQSITGYGCIAGIALVIVSIIVLTRFEIPTYFLVVLAGPVILAPEVLLSRWLLFRHRERNTKHAFTQCSSCGSPCAVSIYEVLDEAVICPYCHHLSMRYSIWNTVRSSRFSLRSIFVVVTLIAIVLGVSTWGIRTYSTVTLDHATADQTNRVLRGFATIPAKATDVSVEYRPYATVSLRFKLTESEAVAWCKRNSWTINPNTRDASWFEFTASQGGGTWFDGDITAVLISD